MKNKKMISTMFASMLMMVLCFTANNSFAQTKTNTDATMMKDCCMMKDGKMMQMKSGIMMPMDSTMTMTNGTMCMTNGECKMKDGKKMKMKEGDCMDMSGKMDKCAMMKNEKQDIAKNYACPMHPEVTSYKEGKCPKCGMELEKTK